VRERSLPSWAPTLGVAIALSALVAWSCAHRYAQLTETPFPVGVDGYFYPIQLRSLLATGHLQYAASPLTFWLMAPLAAATDPITGAKLGAALFGALVALPAYAVGGRLARSRGAGLVAAAVATTSAGSAFMTFEFVKNGVGLTIGLLAVWLLLRQVERPSRARLAAFVIALVAAFLAHKMAAAIVIVIAVPALVAHAAGRGTLRGRRLLYTLLGIAVVSGGAIALGVVFPQRFLSPLDVGLVGDAWTGRAHWDAPALVRPNATLTMGHEALLGGLCAVIAALALYRRTRPLLRDPTPPKRSSGETAAAWAIVVLALAIALPWLAVSDAQALGFRLRVAAFVPLAICAALAVRALLGLVPRIVAVPPARWPVLRELCAAALAVAIVVAMPRDRTEGRIVTHPALVTAAFALAGRVPAGDTVIVPERHIAYMAAWYAQVAVSTRPDAIDRAHRWRLMPLAYIGDHTPLDDALLAARRQPGLAPPIGLHPRHPDGLVLVAEPTWEWILAQLPARDRAHYARWPTY